MLALKAALLSVIIPVYNAEPYLEQCLDSVVNQTYKDLEIICINDGSTDNSLKILEKYQRNDKRIKLINQKNQGVSVARNAGLDVATGEYITFVASDDYLELNAYEEAMKVMIGDPYVDLIEFNIEAFAETNDNILQRRVMIIDKQQIYNLNNKKHSGIVWNKIYKRSIIENCNIRFIPHVKYGDTFFSLAYIISTKKHEFFRGKLYKHRIRNGSIIGDEYSSNFKNQMHLYKNLDALIQYAMSRHIYSDKKNFIFSEYINRIYLFTNASRDLQNAMNHWDKKILDSDCSDKLKVKYLKKRNFIKSQMYKRGYR